MKRDYFEVVVLAKDVSGPWTSWDWVTASVPIRSAPVARKQIVIPARVKRSALAFWSLAALRSMSGNPCWIYWSKVLVADIRIVVDFEVL